MNPIQTVLASGLLGTFLLGGTAAAQADYSFQIDPGQSTFTWSGTSSLGDIDENPAVFSISGDTLLSLDTGGNPVGSGAFVGGDAAVPNLGGSIPNPLPFLPPLATFDLSGAHIQVGSPTFTVDAAGNFTADVTLTILQGTLTANTPLGNSVVDLAGMQSAPSPAAGTLTFGGSAYALQMPVSGTFPFTVPGTTITGSLTLNGSVVADHTPPARSSYCPPSPNSVGAGALLTATGSTSLGVADLVLTATGLPQNQFGVIFYGESQVAVPFGNGTRCVGGFLVRLPLLNSGATGSVQQAIVNGNLPALGQFLVGETGNFQHWYRDPLGGGANFNLSTAVSVTFTP